VSAFVSADCERARAGASLALDCELSELERAWVRAHVAGCPDCAAFVAGLREVTHELRAAPLPKPSRPLAPRLPRRRLVPALVVLAAVLFAAAGGGVAGSLGGSQPSPSVHVSGAKLSMLFRSTPQTRPGSRLPLRFPV
jgi:anti-sigma factor RsiW